MDQRITYKGSLTKNINRGAEWTEKTKETDNAEEDSGKKSISNEGGKKEAKMVLIENDELEWLEYSA